jgi:hypothetical protein
MTEGSDGSARLFLKAPTVASLAKRRVSNERGIRQLKGAIDIPGYRCFENLSLVLIT